MRGFTLSELLICLALVVSLAFFIPGLSQESRDRQALYLIKENIKSAFKSAQNQAVLTGKTHVLMPINDRKWSSGIKILSSVDEELQQWFWPKSSWEVSWEGFTAKDFIPVAPKLLNAHSNGRFIFLNTKTHKIDYLYINRLGRINGVESKQNSV